MPAKTHGQSATREYEAWTAIKARCYNPKNPQFKDYGARSIFLCEEWFNDFPAFLRDMGPCPKDFTLERIDNNKGYSPNNCRWASRAEQMRNTRRTVLITYSGKTQCISDWAVEVGIKRDTLHYRIIKARWAIEKAMTHKSIYRKR